MEINTGKKSNEDRIAIAQNWFIKVSNSVEVCRRPLGWRRKPTADMLKSRCFSCWYAWNNLLETKIQFPV